MRRFFSFKSSASSSANTSQTPPAPPDAKTEKIYSEIPWENDVKPSQGKMVYDGSKTRMDSVIKYLENEDSYIPHPRRSASFSSPITYSEMEDENLSSLSRSSICRSSPHLVAECAVHCHSSGMERYSRATGDDRDTVQPSNATDTIYSPGSSRGHNRASSGSPYSSPIPLRRCSARLQHVMDNNSTLDLYIDGEQHDINKPRKDPHKYFSESPNDRCFAENKVAPYIGRSPRALSTAPSSPTHSMENLRTHSFREVKDFRRHLFTRDHPTSSHRESKPKVKKLREVFSGKSMFKPQDCDSETSSTIEDIYMDTSDPQPTSDSSGICRGYFTDFTVPYESSHEFSVQRPFSDRQSYFCEKGSGGLNSDNMPCSELLRRKSDEELLKNVEEVEHMLRILSDEDLVLERLQTSTLNAPALLQMTRKIAKDRRQLALELSSQIKHRLSERSSTWEGLKHAKFELDAQTRRLQHEKNELQCSLEKELDRRSSDWSLKLEKFQSEEQRLRERVRELAEQNVSMQREISSLKNNEEAIRSKTMDSEMKLDDLTSSLEEARAENHNLHQALAELHERFNGAEEDLDCIRQNYKMKEKESKELQKIVVRLQKMCNEQDKSINGLRRGYSNEIGKKPLERSDTLSMLQMEQLRLTSVEQMLRKELESCRSELESLRHENMCLLKRLQGNRTGSGFFSVKLDKELRDRVDCLQTQGLSLLHENGQFCSKLLDVIKCQQYEYVEEAKKDVDSYSVCEYNLRYQSLMRGIENFRRSLSTVSTVVDDKSNIEAFECHSQAPESSTSRQSKWQTSEHELELELKAESLITRLLREKLCSRELELEQLQSEFATLVWAHDIQQTEIQRLQDELSCLTHTSKDMELQMIKKDENADQLQLDLQECTKELTATRGVLMTISEERDHLQEEVKRSRETIMLLNIEVISLKKKIEALDERVLIKEGEISILKDHLMSSVALNQ